MSRKLERLALFFALFGLGASAASTYVHYQLLRNPAYTSFCDISSTVSCTEAYQSRFGSVAGVPVALIGVLWFVLIMILLIASMRGSERVRENVPAYLFGLSTLGLAEVLYLGYAAFVILKAVCVLCIITYVSVIGLFIISGSTTSFPMTSLPRRALRDIKHLVTTPVALAVTILFVVGAASAVAFFPREGGAAAQTAGGSAAASQDSRSEFERFYVAQPRIEVPIPRDNAKVLIVKFNDFQCPPCRQTYFEYQSILAKYQASNPGAVKFVLQDFPLDPECNVNVPNGQHLAACEAAVAVKLARRSGQGEKLENWLFTNQEKLTPALVRQAAREVAGVTDMDAQYPKVLEQVKSEIALGSLLGVRATPTFFINGIKFQGGLQPNYMDAAIAYELSHAK